MSAKMPTRTEQRMIASTARNAQFMSERKAAEKERAKKVDRLRALRLEKEAADALEARALNAKKSTIKSVRSQNKNGND